MTTSNAIYQFTETYKESCFFSWYENRELARQKMLDALPADENGKRPSYATIVHWRDNYGWIERADALDAEVSRRVETELIEKTAKRYDQLAQVGEEVLQLARNYLKTQGFDSAASAVRAIGLGGDMVAKYAGMADKISLLGDMSPRQLEALAQKLLGQQENDENIINSYAEIVPEDTDNESNPDTDESDE